MVAVVDGKLEGGASLSEDRLMWVSERTPERNSPLFDSQLSDRPSGLAVQGCHPHTVHKWASNTGSATRDGQPDYSMRPKEQNSTLMY